MNRFRTNCLHLLLIGLVLATQVFHIAKSNKVQSLRYVRVLEANERITCSSVYCRESRQIRQRETTYSVSLRQPGAVLKLSINPCNRNDLSLEVNPFENATLHIQSVRPQSEAIAFSQSFPPQAPKAVAIIPGPTGGLTIEFSNGNPPNEADMTLTIIREGANECPETLVAASDTPDWVVPVIVIVGGIILLAMGAIYCYSKRQERRQSTEAILSEDEQALIKTMIDAINVCFPEAEYEKFESSFPQKTCTICLDDMKENQPCRQLDCKHIFHSECSKVWLENQIKKMKKGYCPNCNQHLGSLEPKKGVKEEPKAEEIKNQ